MGSAVILAVVVLARSDVYRSICFERITALAARPANLSTFDGFPYTANPFVWSLLFDSSTRGDGLSDISLMA